MNTELFSEIPREKVKSMLVCLDSSQKSFSAGQTVWEAGKKVTQVGIILSGKLYTESCDVWGNKSIITEYVAGSSFGEAYALAKNVRGKNEDVHNYWHHFGDFNWDYSNRWWAQIAMWMPWSRK